MDDDIKELAKIVKNILSKSEDQSVSHRWGHVKRVYHNCLKIAKYYSNVNYRILEAAALLHDIYQPYNEKKNHAVLSAQKAREILQSLNFNNDEIDKITQIIKEHSSENPDIKPSSIEAKILFDADKIDGVGAVGIARVFAFMGQNGFTPEQAISWYKYKIDLALPQLQTEIGYKMAKEKLAYVINFIKRFERENSVSDIV